jgi:phosphatidylglycerol:prolipoprotein diacylglycerol transferase
VLPYIHIGPLTLGTFGLLLAAGFLAAFFVLRADLRRRGLNGDPNTMVVLACLAGLFGAKLWHLLERPADFFAHPFRLILSPLGFAFYGGLVGGLVTAALLARHYRIPALTMLDLASPATALGYGIGRIGCLISGDGDYGIPTSLSWGMSFPNGLLPTTDRVHPTPIYGFIVAVALSYFLWRLGARSLRKSRPAGETFAFYSQAAPGLVAGTALLLSGAARFLMEFIRRNPRSVLGLTNAQAASVLSIVAGVAILVLAPRQMRAQGRRQFRG